MLIGQNKSSNVYNGLDKMQNLEGGEKLIN